MSFSPLDLVLLAGAALAAAALAAACALVLMVWLAGGDHGARD